MGSDLVLIHAPSIFDFRKRSTLYGPISDVIPSTPVFEMYPVGFATLSNYLEKRHHSVRILNLAVKMLRDKKFDPESCLRKFTPVLFGLDLHWLPHIQGVIEVAKLLKRVHPRIPIVLGGLSASYFHREILENYHEIDFVIRGDCAEEPLAELLKALKGGGSVSDVPNLSYRQADAIVDGVITVVPASLDPYPLNYPHMIRQVHRYRDLTSYFPFKKWFFYPITAVLTCKGCRHSCVTCGGSASAMKRVVGRDQVAYKDPEILAKEVASIIRYIRGPIFFLGDCLQGGRDRFTAMMDTLRPLKIRNEVMVEFFSPPGRDVLRELASTFPRFNIEISPESHDEKIRGAFGRPYGNAGLEQFLEDARAEGCRRLDLFFMTGLPGQDYDSALGTVAYCRDLMSHYGTGMRLVPFISPLAPFVDPGSDVFESPGRHGYRLRFRSLEEHRKAMLAPTWTGMLNYETAWMTRETLAQATYEAAIGLSRLKGEKGLFRKKRTEAVVRRARLEMDIMKSLRSLKSLPSAQRKRNAAALKRVMKRNSGASVCQKEELNMPVGAVRLQVLNLLRLLLTGKGA